MCKTLLFALASALVLTSVWSELSKGRLFAPVSSSSLVVAAAVRLWCEGLGSFEGGLISGLSCFLATVILVAPFAALEKGLGWNEVLLLGAVSMALGFPLGLSALALVSGAGALQAVLLLSWRKVASPKSGVHPAIGGPQIPYSVSVALGSFGAMWWDAG
jgi:hypothetical protein